MSEAQHIFRQRPADAKFMTLMPSALHPIALISGDEAEAIEVVIAAVVMIEANRYLGLTAWSQSHYS